MYGVVQCVEVRPSLVIFRGFEHGSTMIGDIDRIWTSRRCDASHRYQPEYLDRITLIGLAGVLSTPTADSEDNLGCIAVT